MITTDTEIKRMAQEAIDDLVSNKILEDIPSPALDAVEEMYRNMVELLDGFTGDQVSLIQYAAVCIKAKGHNFIYITKDKEIIKNRELLWANFGTRIMSLDEASKMK